MRLGAAAAWVTVTTTGLRVATVTVMFATRLLAVVFCEYDAVIVPLPVPEGVTVHQV